MFKDSIREIYLNGGKIFLEAYRPKDRQSSSVKHEFEFKVHNSWRNSSIEWCAFCLENPDKIGQSMEESLKHRLQTAGVAKPGMKRRKRNEGSAALLGSPNQHNEDSMDNNSFDVSEGSPILQELHDFVDGIDNIDEFVKQDIPDVLMGVMGSDETPSPELQELQRCLSPDASELLQPPGCPPPLLNLQPPGCPAPSGPPPGSRFLETDEFDEPLYPSIHLDYENISDISDKYNSNSSVQNLTPRRKQLELLKRVSGFTDTSSPIMNKDDRIATADSPDTDSISTRSLITRINSLNKKHIESPSDNDSAYKSQDSFSSSIFVSDSAKSPELSEEESKPNISELTRKFGGAKKKCIEIKEKIKSKTSKVDDIPTIKQSRADCFPAFVFMLTPFAVVILAGNS